LQILANEAASNEAPPTRAPSISGHAISSSTVSGLTLPPYWIITFSATSLPYVLVNQARIAPWTDWAISGVADNPVPIAHTGSYAITVLATCSPVKPARSFDNCNVHTSSLRPNSYSNWVSPIHNIGVTPASWILATTLLISPSISLKIALLSEWPTRAYLQPTLFNRPADTAPVNAPESWWKYFWFLYSYM
jgi:hypothetical protein